MQALHSQPRMTLGVTSARVEGVPCTPVHHQRRNVAVAATHHTSTVAAASVVTAVLPSTVQAPPVERLVAELDPKTFYDFIAGGDLCVVDYYSDWCGPCQLMHKEIDKLTSAFKSIKFAKLNCGNCQEFSTRQRIRALPTFRLYYKGACLDEITGAKPVQLRQLLTHYLCMTSINQS